MDITLVGLKVIFNFNFFKLIWERERERERDTDLWFYLLMHLSVDSLMYPDQGIEPAIYMYQDDALTNGGNQPGP